MIRSKPSIFAWIAGVGGVALIVFNVLDTYTTIISFSTPPVISQLGTPAAWLMLLTCFGILWWQVRRPNEAGSDGVVYREMIRLRQDNERLRHAVAEISPRRLSKQQLDLLRARLTHVVSQHPRAPQIAVHWTGSGDTAAYAKQFEEFFESMGFRLLKGTSPSTYPTLKHDYDYGLWVRYSRDRARAAGVPPIGPTLVTALRDAGLDDVTEFDHEEQFLLELIVGMPKRDDATATG